jgi:hypothetical protein
MPESFGNRRGVPSTHNGEALCVGRGKALRLSMFPHGPLLVCFQDQPAAGAGRTQKQKASLAVGVKVSRSRGLIVVSFDQFRGAGQTSALVTDSRQPDLRTGSGVPDELVFRAGDDMHTFGRSQFYGEPDHVTGCRSGGSCCRGLRRVRLAGSVRKEPTSRRAHVPTAQ